ncbi:Xylose isomerase domain-containing protein TIM barrel [Paraburkholderia ribeironis]|uniref:Xylose isomerase domain-containing protein TIM barrel n=1 Tax=Paraburkholderia ribeironis TaxID=1247936 RepID=A0A1N7RMF1_9BURK|nr:TIM barrel protein [Paraburkholderia ribeironis]SIT36282.1 Xylose isomerase domain-containing protein TIM barrel [Paraburkholderia ribeironis]
MRIAISNIAWEVADDQHVADILQQYRVDAIDVAPGKYFPDPKTAEAADIARVRGWWSGRGIAITGMQSLLFGTTGLNVFGTAESQQAMLEHLRAVCRVGAGLGAQRLVFGSPRNRDRTGLTDDAAHDIAVTFFRRVGDIAAEQGVFVCLEPNPPCYGANFMTNSRDTATVVSAVAHPAIRMQLDTGAVTINEENVRDVVTQYAQLIGHVHASEPNLVTLGEGGTNHRAVADVLTELLPQQVVSIEMLAPKSGSAMDAVRRAVGEAVRCYRSDGGACA